MERFAAAARAAQEALRRVLRAMTPGMLICELCASGDGFIQEEAAAAEAALPLEDPEGEAEGGAGAASQPPAGPAAPSAAPPSAPSAAPPSAPASAPAAPAQPHTPTIGDRLRYIGFPTSVTPNPLLGDYSPSSRSASLTLLPGTVYKIKLATLVHGAYGYAATTVVLRAEPPYFGCPIEGGLAAALAACHVLSRTLPRYFRAGAPSTQVPSHVECVAEHFGVRPVVGVNCEVISPKATDFLQHKFVPGAELPATYEPIPAFSFKPDYAVVVDLMLSCGGVEPIADQRPPCVFNLDTNIVRFAPGLLSAGSSRMPMLPRLNGRGMLGKRDIAILQELQQHPYPFTARCLGTQAALQGLNPISAYLLPFTLAHLDTKSFAQVGFMLYIAKEKTYLLSSPVLPNIIRSSIAPSEEMLRRMRTDPPPVPPPGLLGVSRALRGRRDPDGPEARPEAHPEPAPESASEPSDPPGLGEPSEDRAWNIALQGVPVLQGAQPGRRGGRGRRPGRRR